MTRDIEIKERILQTTKEMFYKFGYSKVTMEEIAADLGISKKTLYKHFSNKEHILKEIVNGAKCEIETYVENLLDDKKTDLIFQRFKELADKKKEIFDEDLIALVEEETKEKRQGYELLSIQVFTGTDVVPQATVKIKYKKSSY